MAYLGKVYTYVKHENFDTWLKSVGLPEDRIAAIIAEKPISKIVKDGDGYIITQSTPKGDKDTKFTSGVEFDDTIGDNTAIKTTYTVDGNVVTQQIKSSLGIATFKREFNGDDLVVTITSDKYDGVAKRYYKA